MPNSEDSWAFQSFQHLDSLIDSLLGSLEINIGNTLDAFQSSGSNSSNTTDSIFDGRYTEEIWSDGARPAGVFGWNYYANGSAVPNNNINNMPSMVANNVEGNHFQAGPHNRFPVFNRGQPVTLPSIGGNGSTTAAVHNTPQNVRPPSLNGATVVNGVNLATLKFVKPAPQCYFWESRQHRIEHPNCRLWHPRELCKYYPKCTLSAEVCGFGHPFCGEYCECDPNNRSLQVNHRISPHLSLRGDGLSFHAFSGQLERLISN